MIKMSMEHGCFRLLIWYLIRTFLKTSRVHPILPKHSKKTGCCAFTMIIGRIRWNSIGSKYQFDWSRVSLISSNASVILWPSSQAINTATSPQSPLKIDSKEILARIFPLLNWNRPNNVMIVKNEGRQSTQLFPLEWSA